LTRRQAGPSLLRNPQVEWFDRVVVPFTSVEGPNEGGSAFGVERAIRAVTIAFWASLLLNFRRALRPSAGVATPQFDLCFQRLMIDTGAEPGFDSDKFFKLRLDQYRNYRAVGERALDALRGVDVDCGLPFLRRLVSCGLFRGFLQERTRLQVWMLFFPGRLLGLHVYVMQLTK
jgi:hypothetical protein